MSNYILCRWGVKNNDEKRDHKPDRKAMKRKNVRKEKKKTNWYDEIFSCAPPKNFLFTVYGCCNSQRGGGTSTGKEPTVGQGVEKTALEITVTNEGKKGYRSKGSINQVKRTGEKKGSRYSVLQMAYCTNSGITRRHFCGTGQGGVGGL